MEKFFDIIKKLRPGVQSGKVSREAALRELIQESGVSEEIAETAVKNMVGAQPEVPGGITSLKPDVTFTPTQKELPEPIDMSVEERTGGMLKEGKEGEYISTMDQESGAANVDPSIMSLGDKDDFKYEMAVFRQNRQKKLEPIYKKYGAVSKEEKDFVDDFIGLDSEDRVELLKSDPKYKTSTTKLFIEDTVKNQPGIKQEELMEVVYGSTGEKILKERGLNDYIQYAKKEIEELGGSLNEDLLMRGLKDGFNDPEGFASGGRIGFKEGVGRKGILSALTDKLNEIAPGSTGIGKTTKAMSEKAKRRRAEEEMFKNFENRNPDPKRQLTDDEIREYEEELGDSETWMSLGTLGEAEQALKRQKQYEAAMYRDYKAGRLDPKPGEKGRKEFLEQKLQEMEMSGDKKLMTKDEIEELSTFDLGTEMEEFKNTKSRLQKKYKGVIDEYLLSKMMVDNNAQRLAELEATIDEALTMQSKGMPDEEIISMFKKTPRTKQAKGGLSYLMGM